MVRVYNNEPYECYKETEEKFDTEDEALVFIYTHYYYRKVHKIQLFNDGFYGGDGSIQAHMDEFTVEEAKKTLNELRAKNEEWRFFEFFDYEVMWI